MRRRSHKNTTRLTAKERAYAAFTSVWSEDIANEPWAQDEIKAIQRAIQAHARATLARERARRGGAR